MGNTIEKRKERKYSKPGEKWGVVLDCEKNMKMTRKYNYQYKPIKKLVINILREAKGLFEWRTIDGIMTKMREKIFNENLGIDLQRIKYRAVYKIIDRCLKQMKKKDAGIVGHIEVKVIKKNGRDYLAFRWSTTFDYDDRS